MKNDTFKLLAFLEGRFPSKAYMKATEAKSSTLHAWKDKKHIDFPHVGSGKAMFLNGTDIVLLRCLVILSNLGFCPKFMCLSDLLEKIKQYAQQTKESQNTEEVFAVFWRDENLSHPRKETNAYGVWSLETRETIFSDENQRILNIISLTKVSEDMAEKVVNGY